eukprot:1465853-Amphidinium_carterae.2
MHVLCTPSDDVRMRRCQKKTSEGIEDQKVKKVRFQQSIVMCSRSDEIPWSTVQASGSSDIPPASVKRNVDESKLPDRAAEEIITREIRGLVMGVYDEAETEAHLDEETLDWRGTHRVKAAREPEIKLLDDFGVYEKVPKEQTIDGEYITVTWVHVNNCDEQKPEYRSRIAAELKSYHPERERQHHCLRA